MKVKSTALRFAVAVLLSGALVACDRAAAPSATAVPPPAPPPAGPRAQIPAFAQPDDGSWPMAARDYASTRFSSQAQITTANVAQLRPEIVFSLGLTRGEEAAPIVAGDTMYVVTAWPNNVYAVSLTPGSTFGQMRWRFTPTQVPAAQGVACCDVVNRGGVVWRDRFIFNTLDGATIALDTRTGRQVWRTQLGNINRGETITMAPLVVRDRVLVGNSGGEFGVRGWLTALNASDGSIAWRAYHTGPDRDALIGADFHPFYAMDQGRDLGVSSWPADAWRMGGGTVWGWISYDPELDLIYYGTGNPGPWNPEQRPGDNKWTTGLFARNPETGAARWFYQFTPHDEQDYDAINESVLLDMPVNGQMRRVAVRPERNGYMYVFDRTNGQVLSATPYMQGINASLGVDLNTGRYMPNPEKQPRMGRTVRNICPTASGAKDWNPSAFSPRTGLLYVPAQNMCMDWESLEVSYIAGTPYVGANVRMFAGPGGNRGVLTAWDPVNRRPAWSVREDLPIWSGALATAGDVVFYGTMDNWFKAVDARTGRELWRFQTDSGIISQPVSFRGPDGRQYIAVLSGVGGWAGAVVAGNLDPRDPTAALGMAGATADLPGRTSAGGSLYVFALPRR